MYSVRGTVGLRIQTHSSCTRDADPKLRAGEARSSVRRRAQASPMPCEKSNDRVRRMKRRGQLKGGEAVVMTYTTVDQLENPVNIVWKAATLMKLLNAVLPQLHEHAGIQALESSCFLRQNV